MASPFLSEIRMFGFDFPPKGWAACNGQLLAIAQNQALFSLLGTTFGGNGQTNFALPNLRGRTPLHFGQGAGLSNVVLGEITGAETVTLTVNEIPLHSHVPQGSSANASALSPAGNVWAKQPDGYLPYAATGGAAMNPGALASAGGSQPHSNLQPYLVVNFCIAITGIFPSRN